MFFTLPLSLYSHYCFCVFFKQNAAYELRISAWSSDLCSSDLLVDTELAGYGFGGSAAVAGQHHHLDPALVQRPNGRSACRLDRIGDRDQPSRCAIEGYEHHSLTLGASGFCGREPFRIIDTEPPHQLLVANSDLLRSHARLDTLAGGRRQIRRCLERQDRKSTRLNSSH